MIGLQVQGLTRRRFLGAAIGLAAARLMRPSVAVACPAVTAASNRCPPVSWIDGGRTAVEGYPSQISCTEGDRVVLFLSSEKKTRAILAVERLGLERKVVRSAVVEVGPKPMLAGASENGCEWEAGDHGQWSFEIPPEWSSGFYRIVMSDPSDGGNDQIGEAFFVVRSPRPGRDAKVVLLLSTNTYFAYNNYGAQSGLPAGSTRGGFYEQARAASFMRPLPRGFLSSYDCGKTGHPSRHQRYAGWDKWEWPFVQWAEGEGLTLEYATNEDLERQPGILSAYRLVLSVGHDEYWSSSMRDAIDSYVVKGGNVAFFSGNVCYRHIRFEPGAFRMVLEGEMDGSALWSHREGVDRPENTLTGVSFCYGALNPRPVPYTIYQPDHWLFDGVWSSRVRQERFPTLGCIGYECDGCDVDWVKGFPVASHRDRTPESFQILGLAPGAMPDYEARVHSRALFGREDGHTPWGKDLRQGAAVMGLWTGGGTVVTVGCTEWARHLSDPAVSQITRNILRKLSR